MHKFIFEITEFNENWKEIDTFTTWITAKDEVTASGIINSVYPYLKNYKVKLINKLDV